VDGQQLALTGQNGGDDLSIFAEPLDKSEMYWATWKGKDLSSALDEKQTAYINTARSRGLVNMWIVAYAAHHGLTPEDLRDFATQQIGFGGNELELIRFHLNIVRSYTRHQSIMALGEDPAFKAIVVNSDHKSQAKAELSDKIVNSLYKRYSQKYDARVCEGDGFAGMAFTHYRWDFSAGDDVQVDQPVLRDTIDDVTGRSRKEPVLDEEGQPITHPQDTKSGAPVVTMGYPWDLFMETRSSGETLWATVCEMESRWNVIGQFPAMKDALLKVPSNSVSSDNSFAQLFRIDEVNGDDSDLVIVKHFYHARSAAIPDGRYAVMCGDAILWDGPCPTKEGLPIAMMKSADFIGTTFGYCDGWDLLAINQALNQVNSDELLNYANFGRQSTYSEKGTNVTVDGLTKGTHYEFPTGGRPPGAIALTAIPPTLPDLKRYLHSMLDSISGQNATSRGDPEANVRSGEMAALLDSIALRYQSYRQQAARDFRMRGATIIVDMINRYGETPFLAEIAGIEDRSYISEFTRDDLSGVERITMDVVSPLMQTISGRLQLFMQLKELLPADRAAAYELIVSGDPSAFTSRDRSSDMKIRRENEDLVTGERECPVAASDDPYKHVPKHTAQREQIESSDNPDHDAIKRLNDHILEHTQVYLDSSPVLASFLNITTPPTLYPSESNPWGNPSYQFAVLTNTIAQGPIGIAPGGQLAAGATGQPTPNSAPQTAGSGPGVDANGGAPMPTGAPPGDAAQMNDGQGIPQDHPSGTSLPQPSTPPGQ
jgi:hypothetical protein